MGFYDRIIIMKTIWWKVDDLVNWIIHCAFLLLNYLKRKRWIAVAADGLQGEQHKRHLQHHLHWRSPSAFGNQFFIPPCLFEVQFYVSIFANMSRLVEIYLANRYQVLVTADEEAFSVVAMSLKGQAHSIVGVELRLAEHLAIEEGVEAEDRSETTKKMERF